MMNLYDEGGNRKKEDGLILMRYPIGLAQYFITKFSYNDFIQPCAGLEVTTAGVQIRPEKSSDHSFDSKLTSPRKCYIVLWIFL